MDFCLFIPISDIFYRRNFKLKKSARYKYLLKLEILQIKNIQITSKCCVIKRHWNLCLMKEIIYYECIYIIIVNDVGFSIE